MKKMDFKGIRKRKLSDILFYYLNHTRNLLDLHKQQVKRFIKTYVKNV